MRYAVCLLLLAVLAPAIQAQMGLTVECEPVVEGKATPGGEYTLKLRFTVPDGYHAYHKDNPGYSQPVNVTWKELSGLELVKDTWPEPHKHADDYGEEWELSGTFDIAYTFKVPADASGTLTVSGHHETQFCDADGCMQSEDDFTAEIPVEGAAATEEPELPIATAELSFTGPAQPGGQATLEWKFTFTKGFHCYAKGNPGTGIAPEFTWSELSGLKLVDEQWPTPEKVEDADLGEEWEYPDGVTIKFIFDVPEDAKGDLPIKAKWSALVCDPEACFMRDGHATATLTVTEPEKPAFSDEKNELGFYLDFDYAINKALEEERPLLVDFNGKFCGPCRRMEKTVFVLPEVQELMKKFVIVSVQNDIDNARYNELWEKYRPSKKSGVPYYAVIDPEDPFPVVRGIASTLPAETHAVQFIAFLKGDPIPEVKEAVDPSKLDKDWPKGLPGPQPDEFKNDWDFESYFSAEKVRPGGEVTLVLKFKLKSRGSGPFHMYHPDSPHADGMSLFQLKQVDAGGLEPVGDWRFPQYRVIPVSDPGNNFEADEWAFGGEFTVTRTFKVPDDAEAGRRLVTGTLAGQYCDQKGCIWFTDLEKTPMGFIAALEVAPDGVEKSIVDPSMNEGDHAETGTQKTPPKAGQGEKGDDAGESNSPSPNDNIFLFILLTFLGGMVTLLTPCVLPVLPLTVSFFVKQAEHKRSPLLTAFIYCTCIVATFTVFGLLTSLLLKDQGAQIISTNPFVNIAIGVLFVVFALSFFGLFELRAPAFLTGWISKKQMKNQQAGKGYATALLSGGSFAVISFSCTGPIAATFLAEAAHGSFWMPTLAMLSFSSGMALPIFVMGMFPSLLKKLPKSGGWMNALKVTFAFIEIAVAIRYFAWADLAWSSTQYPNFITREVVDAFWIACMAGSGLYLLGLFRMPHDHEPAEKIGVVRLLFALAFLGFAVYMVPGLVRGAPMGLLDGFLPPRNPELYASANPGGGGGSGAPDVHSLKWHQDLDEAMAESKKTGKPVFIDFTGRICSNCRWVETNIFPRKPVSEMLAGDFVLCQQYTDIGDKKAVANYEKYGQGEKGVPMYVIVDADGKQLEKFVPPQFINSLTPDEFGEFMKRGKEKFAAGGS
ncbi:MAG: thioredoxin family protein [Planctomycetes bacterium]|nr:thioredoxin family protein [Planctomycetota bacterium]